MSRTLFLVALAACSDSATIGDGYKVVVRTMENPPSKLDVLFVVDDSPSITDDQQALIAAAREQLFPQLQLADGSSADLHIGVVSSSVTVAGFPSAGSPGTVCADFAQYTMPDGKLLAGSWMNPTSCAMMSAPYLATDGTVANFTGDIGDAFACMAALGHDGCGFEQPLEAMQLGLTRADNASFLRDDAMLLVVFLTDEDDSSKIAWSRLDDGNDRLWQGQREYELGVDCDPADLHQIGMHGNCTPRPDTTDIAPIEPYISFLQTLKDDPSLVMIAGIAPPTGPLSIIQNPTASDVIVDSICVPPPGPCVDDPTMTCDRDGVAPAIRLTAFAASFPGRYVLPSICEAQTDEAVHRIARSVRNVMTNGTCVSSDVPEGRCRAMSVAAIGERHQVSLAFVEDDDACDYTPSHLRADATPRTGEHLEVECL